MRSGVITFQDRQAQRLGNLAREAALHARDGLEVRRIERVVEAAHLQVLTFEQARQALATLRADQRAA